jgi:mRNA interferase HigB
MKVIGLDIIKNASARHPNAASAFHRWYQEAETAVWTTPQDIKNRFASVSFLSDNRAVFNIGGNRYRLVVVVKYARGAMVVLMAGNHAEYDAWNRSRK